MSIQTISDAAHEAIKGTVAVIGAATAWITLSKVVAALTAGYVTIQAVYLLRKWYREERDWADYKKRQAAP